MILPKIRPFPSPAACPGLYKSSASKCETGLCTYPNRLFHGKKQANKEISNHKSN